MLQKLTVKVFKIFSYLLSIFVLRYINSGEQTTFLRESSYSTTMWTFFFVPSDGGHAHCGSSLFKITQLKINIRAD